MFTPSRVDCYALINRLHFAGYHHNSVFERNIVVQPGPLTAPPDARSIENPSYRVIDFGRTNCLEMWTKDYLRRHRDEDEDEMKVIAKSRFSGNLKSERGYAKEELRLHLYNDI